MLTEAECKNVICPPDKKQTRFTDSGGTDSLLVPYTLAVRAEGFGFDYARWQQVNDATIEE